MSDDKAVRQLTMEETEALGLELASTLIDVIDLWSETIGLDLARPESRNLIRVVLRGMADTLPETMPEDRPVAEA